MAQVVPVVDEPKELEDWAVGELGAPGELKDCVCNSRVNAGHPMWKITAAFDFKDEDLDPAVFRRLKPGKTGGHGHLGDQKQRDSLNAVVKRLVGSAHPEHFADRFAYLIDVRYAFCLCKSGMRSDLRVLRDKWPKSDSAEIKTMLAVLQLYMFKAFGCKVNAPRIRKFVRAQ
jgi:hypothetical protein